MQVMYGHKEDDDIYRDIHPHPGQVRMTEDIRHPREIYKLSVREVEEGESSIYWGWKDNHELYSMVFENLVLLKVCFPYGIEAAEVHGQGKRVNLVVEEIE